MSGISRNRTITGTRAIFRFGATRLRNVHHRPSESSRAFVHVDVDDGRRSRTDRAPPATPAVSSRRRTSEGISPSLCVGAFADIHKTGSRGVVRTAPGPKAAAAVRSRGFARGFVPGRRPRRLRRYVGEWWTAAAATKLTRPLARIRRSGRHIFGLRHTGRIRWAVRRSDTRTPRASSDAADVGDWQRRKILRRQRAH